MKKIICLICLIGMMQSVFAGDHFDVSWNNYAGGSYSAVGVPVMNVIANYGDSVNLQAMSYCSGGYAPPVKWYFNGDSIPNTSGANIIYVVINQYGTYSAPLGSCFQGVTVYFHVNNTTGISSINNINFLKVFPTVVNSSITIQLNSTKINDVEISFFDVSGKQLKNYFYKNVFGELIKNENTEALAKGIYFIKIKAGDEVMERKFVKR